MKILIAGATGFLGRAAVARFRAAGADVAVTSRDPARAREALGPDVEVIAFECSDEELRKSVSGREVVVNLVGEPVAGVRWTARRRSEIERSRVAWTMRLASAIRAAQPRPAVFLAGSASGFYGDRGDEKLDESSAAGTGYLSDLCRAWEAAAEVAGLRVVLLRTGVVLGQGGGALAKMMLPFRLGLGGPLGSGRQWVSWIHRDDWADACFAAATDARLSGPVDFVSPEPVRFADFARALGRALHRPAFLPLPAFALRLVFGESASVLLDSQRIRPAALAHVGFRFRFPTLDAALAEVVNQG